MSDLISRSALIKYLTIDGYIPKAIKEAIELQPTAYDVEKVVEELEEERISAENEMHRLRDGEYALPCQFDRTDIEECIMETMSKAIDIVRKGGVE